MLNAAKIIDIETPEFGGAAPRRVSRFNPRDPEQILYRRMLSELDEDALMSLETDLEYFLAGGSMSPRLATLLDAGLEAA